MQQLEGFEVKGKENLVFKLKKSLYELKKTPRQWYKKFDSFMMSHGYNRTTSDHCVLTRKLYDDEFIILLLCLDDMLIIGHDSIMIDKLKRVLSKSFAMKVLGSEKQIFGMKISRDKKIRKLCLSQESYIEKVLVRFNMSKAKTICSLLASHLKLSSKQCPISEKDMNEMSKVPHAVGVVSWFFIDLRKEH